MRKLDKKGFMLAEVIIVSAIMIGVMVSMYVSFNRLYTAYDERSRYYDIDGLYAMKNIQNMLINDLNLNSLLGKNINLIKDGSCSTSFSNCDDFKTNYKINNLYLYDKNSYANITGSKTLKDYITYLSNNVTFDAEEKNIMIIEIKKNNQGNDKDYYYAYLKIKS